MRPICDFTNDELVNLLVIRKCESLKRTSRILVDLIDRLKTQVERYRKARKDTHYDMEQNAKKLAVKGFPALVREGVLTGYTLDAQSCRDGNGMQTPEGTLDTWVRLLITDKDDHVAMTAEVRIRQTDVKPGGPTEAELLQTQHRLEMDATCINNNIQQANIHVMEKKALAHLTEFQAQAHDDEAFDWLHLLQDSFRITLEAGLCDRIREAAALLSSCPRD